MTAQNNVFQGLTLDDLQPCSFVEQKQIANGNISSKVVVEKDCFPFPVGHVIFDGGSLLGLGERNIRAVGMVLEGQRKSSTVMLLEVNQKSYDYGKKKQGEVAFFTDYCTWIDPSSKYQLSAEQQSLFDQKSKEWKRKKAEKRKREREEQASKKSKIE